MQKMIIGVLLVLSAVGVWYWAGSKQPLSPSVDAGQLRVVTHSLTLTSRALTPSIVTVTEGDEVTLKVMSDEAGDFHVSGYEIENPMTAGTELSFSFTADKAGRYNFELHPKTEEVHDATDTHTEGEEDIVLGAFVVNPR